MKKMNNLIVVLIATGFLNAFSNPVSSKSSVTVAKTAVKISQKVADDDEDKDGVPNEIDLCPHTPFGVEVDPNGCPIGF